MSRSILIAFTSAIVTAAIISVAAPAQSIRNHNSNAPVDFNAGQIELQDRANRVVLSGGVTATQAGLSIKSSRLTAAYSGKDVDRLDATGGVIIVKEDLRATSNAAIYDLKSDLITLLGNVKLVQGTNRLNGARIVIDLNAGRSTITGSGNSSNPGSGGRVTGTFTVPQRKN